MFLPSLSQHLGFPRLIDPFIRFDDSRILVRQDRTPSSRPYNHFADLISVTPVGLFLSRPRRFTTAFCTYSENPTRLISSTPKSFGPLLPARPNHIYPLEPKPDDCGLLRETILPLLVVLQEVFLWLGP